VRSERAVYRQGNAGTREGVVPIFRFMTFMALKLMIEVQEIEGVANSRGFLGTALNWSQVEQGTIVEIC
jgi:hypothetical protein